MTKFIPLLLYRPALQVILVAAVYYFAARLGLLMALGNTNASPVWPPSGAAFAAAILLGRGVWPGIFIGAFTANAVVFFQNETADTLTVILASVSIAAGNTLEAISGHFLLSRFNAEKIFSHTKNFAVFFISSLLMCAVSSSVGSFSLLTSGIISPSAYGEIWFTWWMGDVAGILALTPVLLSLWENGNINPNEVLPFRFIIPLVILISYLGIVFCGWPSSDYYKANIYPVFIFLVWCVFSMNIRKTSLVVLLISVFSIVSTLNGYGPFIETSQNASLISLQVFLCVASVSMLFLSISLNEKRQTEQQLKTLNNTLEKKIEDRIKDLEKQKKELEDSNRELKLFAHAASHDLQEPLRTIVSFLQILEAKSRDKFTRDELDYIGFVINASKRMKRLIGDLLSYSKIEKKEPDSDTLDCSLIIRDALAGLKQTLVETKTRVTVNQLPALRSCNEMQLVLLFQNLISNAVKYRAAASPHILISSHENGQEWIFSVQDNGIGIEQRHHKKIFEIFHRLHSMDSYDGTGIGLAICRKIVENHGGRIWVESSPGTGSVFHFTISKNRA